MCSGRVGAGVTRDNVKQLLLSTGAREVHVGSACQENVPRTVPREDDASVRLGFVDEGGIGYMIFTSSVALVYMF